MMSKIEMNTKKLSVVWLCHFTDDNVQKQLKPWRSVAQFAPWISNTLTVFENSKEVDLHIVAPHGYIRRLQEYQRNSIHYHFFNPYIPFLGRPWPSFFRWDVWTSFAKNKRVVRKLMNQIHPDIIHLQGAENPYYSATAIQFIGEYPVLVNLQRLNLEFNRGKTMSSSQRVDIEKYILDSAHYFSIRTKTMVDTFKEFNAKAKTYWVNYMMPQYCPIETVKEYDIVYFARVSKEKGIEDLIAAFGLIKTKLPDAKLCVIGGVNDSYRSFLEDKAKLMGVVNGITWKGQLPSLKEVHIEASKAKVSVLPTHNDIIPGTIIESMQLGLPVVSYKTGSIPELNKDQENISLVEKGDIAALADRVVSLLTDQQMYASMSKRGIDCIRNRYGNQNVFKQHLDCYLDVIADFQKTRD